MSVAVAVERFREVPSHTIDSAELEAARAVMRCVCAALRLPTTIRLRWFRSINGLDEWEEQRNGGSAPWHMFTTDERTVGQMSQRHLGEIWIRADRGPRQVAETVAHELRHIWQVPKYGRLSDAGDIEAMATRLERDAEQFAQTAITILQEGHHTW